MISWTTFKDVVLFLLAIYAAALSTFNLWHITRKERRRIRVMVSTAMPTYGAELGPPFIQLQAINDGHRVTNVSVLTLQLPDKRRIWQLSGDGFPGVSDTNLPATLGEGEIAYKFLPYGDIGAALISHGYTTKTKLVPVCEDTTGGCYTGEPLVVDPAEYVRMGRG